MLATLSTLKPPTSVAAIHEYAEEAEAEILRLCEMLHIRQAHIHEYNTMSAYLFPYADYDALITIGLFNNFLYYVDDVYDRHNNNGNANTKDLMATFQIAADILVNGTAVTNNHPILLATQEIHRRLVELAPDKEWFYRFTHNTIEHLASSLHDVDDNIDVTGTTWFDKYNEIRDLDSGMAPTIDLIEFALGCTMDESIRNHPLINQAKICVARYCSLSNDLFSYDKEVVFYGSEFNAVVMLERDGHHFESAVDTLIHYLNQLVDDFVDVYQGVSREISDTLEGEAIMTYMDCLWYQIVAAYHWQFSTNRYRSHDSCFAELIEPIAIAG